MHEARREYERAVVSGRAATVPAANGRVARVPKTAAAGGSLVHAAGQKRSAKAAVVPEAAVPEAVLPEIRVGCSGWYYWHWNKTFYPAELARKDWFAFYASQFDTVELNAPFYSWPTVATVRQWLRQLPLVPATSSKRKALPRPFAYTVKVCELITHVKRFTGTQTLVGDFEHIADLLGPHMGCFLFQLPPSFHYTEARLRKIVEQLDQVHQGPVRRNVVEFRHASWWNARVYRAFRRAGICFCSSSGPRMPDALVHTADDVYVRFHGTRRWYRHDYLADELEVWARRIRTCGARRVWAYFNNDRDGYAIKNARMLREMLGRLGVGR